MAAQLSFAEFQKSTVGAAPPAGLGAPLRALWHDARGEWDAAHALAQEAGGLAGDECDRLDGAWVHAYLHRKEGDEGNAGYWYQRAGRPAATCALAAEWAAIARELLGRG